MLENVCGQGNWPAMFSKRSTGVAQNDESVDSLPNQRIHSLYKGIDFTKNINILVVSKHFSLSVRSNIPTQRATDWRRPIRSWDSSWRKQPNWTWRKSTSRKSERLWREGSSLSLSWGTNGPRWSSSSKWRPTLLTFVSTKLWRSWQSKLRWREREIWLGRIFKPF